MARKVIFSQVYFSRRLLSVIAIILTFLLLLVFVWVWYDAKLRALNGVIKELKR